MKSEKEILIEIEKRLESIPSFRLVRNTLRSNDFFIAGGFLRELIIGNKGVKDIDIFIGADLPVLQPALNVLTDNGKLTFGPFGSPRWQSFDDDFYYDIVPFSNFVVADRKLSTMEEILENFDITINAIAYDIDRKKLIDPVNGIADINNRVIRAVHLNFPDKKIRDGEKEISTLSIFWFRLLHYKNTLSFSFDQKTLRWIEENRFRIKDLEVFEQMFFKPEL